MAEKITEIPRETFPQIVTALADLFCDSMEQTPPYNRLNGGRWMHRPATVRRFMREFRGRSNARTLLAEINNQMAGAVMFRAPALEKVRTLYGLSHKKRQIAKLVEQLMAATGISSLVHIDRTFVRPDFQRQGLATRLREALLIDVGVRNPSGVVIFTNHQSDNPHIIRISEAQGFHSTGIITSQTPEMFEQYWVKVIPPTFI